jgi:hypothetical protein
VPGKALVRVVAPLATAAAAASAAGAGTSDEEELLVTTANESFREPLESVAAPPSGADGDDDGMGDGAEQTWPEDGDDEEAGDDDGDEGDAAMGGGGAPARAPGSRRLAGGRARWLTPGLQAGLDMVDEEDEEDDEEEGDDDDDDDGGDASGAASSRAAKEASTVEGRERLQARARRRTLRKRGMLGGEGSELTMGGGDDDDKDDGDGDAEHGDAGAGAFLALGEDAAVAGLPFIDLEIGRGRSGDIGRPIGRASHHLRRNARRWRCRKHIVEPGDGVGIIDAQRSAGAGAAEDAALPPGAGGDDQQVGAEPRN